MKITSQILPYRTKPQYSLKPKSHLHGVSGTHKIGTLKISYQDLVEMFGEPIEATDSKVDVEWLLEDTDGRFFTIHNWKDGSNYLGGDGMPVDEIMEWSVGGTDYKHAEPLSKFFGDKFTARI